MDIALSNEAINGATTLEHELRLVDPRELHAVWPLVRAGVEKVAERGGDEWLPEDMYAALKQGVSLLAVGFVEKYYVGFLVVTPSIGWTGPQLHLWAVYSRGQRDVLATFLPDLVELARTRGATRITMSSSREGWRRVAPKLGFHETQQHYALEV